MTDFFAAIAAIAWAHPFYTLALIVILALSYALVNQRAYRAGLVEGLSYQIALAITEAHDEGNDD